MRVVVLIMDGIAKDPCENCYRILGVMKLSENIGYYNEVDPIAVRQWALTFIQNGGIFNNHSYKKREPAGVIADPAARGDMKRWMMLACRAKPPVTAKDFMGFVNAEYNTNIKERTAQIWLHLIGFKWRGAQSLEIFNDGQQRQDVKDYTQCYCIDMLDIVQQSITYTGPNMDIIVKGARLVDANSTQIIVSYHDECNSTQIIVSYQNIANMLGKLMDKEDR